MAAKNDDATGYCCCALIVVGVVITIIGWIADFVGNHPVWTAVIVLTLVGGAILALNGAGSDSEDLPAQKHGEAAGTSTGPSRPLSVDAKESVSPAAAIARRPANPRPLLDEMKSPETSREEASAQRTSPDGAHGDDIGPALFSSENDDVGTAMGSPDTPEPIMAPETFKTAAKALLRRDQWTILGAGFASAHGGIDIIASRGASIIAVQCYAPTVNEPLDVTTAVRLLSAPFDVHRIEEIVLVASVPISDAADGAVGHDEKRIHVVDGDEFLEWHRGHRQLEPWWGLITPTAP